MAVSTLKTLVSTIMFNMFNGAVVFLGSALEISHSWIYFAFPDVISLCIFFPLNVLNHISFTPSSRTFVNFVYISSQLSYLFSPPFNEKFSEVHFRTLNVQNILHLLQWCLLFLIIVLLFFLRPAVSLLPTWFCNRCLGNLLPKVFLIIRILCLWQQHYLSICHSLRFLLQFFNPFIHALHHQLPCTSKLHQPIVLYVVNLKLGQGADLYLSNLCNFFIIVALYPSMTCIVP